MVQGSGNQAAAHRQKLLWPQSLSFLAAILQAPQILVVRSNQAKNRVLHNQPDICGHSQQSTLLVSIPRKVLLGIQARKAPLSHVSNSFACSSTSVARAISVRNPPIVEKTCSPPQRCNHARVYGHMWLEFYCSFSTT